MPTARPSIHFVSLGCVKNRVDTEVMLGVAQGAGYDHVDDPAKAEVIVVNTCGFIGEAKKESIDTIFELGRLKDDGACRRLVVAGCLSQRHPRELADEMPEVDHFLGSSDMLKLGEVLRGKADRMLVGSPAEWLVRSTDPRTVSTGRASAYVKIAEGCNRSCSFCVIPQLRGKQRSRSADDVVREVEELAAGGALEINLISQDTVAYGRDLAKDERRTLADLVRRVADVPGLRWVRLFYLYPETLTDELVELLAHHPKVVPYVDMPLQHAADAMLRRMKRGHGGARLRSVVERLRRDVPGLVFRTAFIVGHPGETDAEFTELCDLVAWAKFDRVAVFRFSDEDGVATATMPDKVPTRTANARYRKLMTLQRRISHAINQRFIGQELDVLLEGTSDEHEYVSMGRHAGQAPEIDGQVYLSADDDARAARDLDRAHRPGTMQKVRITDASDYDLVGQIIDDGSAPSLGRAAQRRGRGRDVRRTGDGKISLRVVPSDHR